jgi:nucleoside-diphosphate-sugar epimerase
MKVFVTGATGVIGRRLVPMLRADRHDVTAIVRSSIKRAQLQQQGVTPVDVDLFDRTGLIRAVSGHEVVINLVTHIPRSTFRMLLRSSWRENDRLRREASANLVDACIATGVSRFVQESFAPVYPDRGDQWIDESVPLSPSKYNRTVLDAEASTGRFSRSGGAGVVLRFGGFYGHDALQTDAFIQSIRRGWAPLPGPPTAYISSVSHDDAATAARAALMLPSGVYNVVDDRPVTHREFCDSLAEALAVPAPKFPPVWLTPLFGSIGEMAARSLRISNRKLRAASPWTPKYPSVRQGWPAVLAHMDAAESQVLLNRREA